MEPDAPPDRPHQLRAVRLGDRPDAWAAAGFAVVDHHDGTGTVQLGRTTLELSGAGGGVEGWALDGVDHAVDGLPRIVPWDRPASAPDAPHPNGVLRIDHVVLLTGDVPRSVAALEAAGLEVRGTRAARSAGAPAVQVFLWAGDVILELVGPAEGGPTSEGPTTVMGLALAVADLDASARDLGELLGTPRDAVQPGRRVATLRHGRVGMHLPLLLMSPHVTAGRDGDG